MLILVAHIEVGALSQFIVGVSFLHDFVHRVCVLDADVRDVHGKIDALNASFFEKIKELRVRCACGSIFGAEAVICEAGEQLFRS